MCLTPGWLILEYTFKHNTKGKVQYVGYTHFTHKKGTQSHKQIYMLYIYTVDKYIHKHCSTTHKLHNNNNNNNNKAQTNCTQANSVDAEVKIAIYSLSTVCNLPHTYLPLS